MCSCLVVLSSNHVTHVCTQITTEATEWLNGNHTVFGKVVGGMDVVREMEGVGSSSGTPGVKVTIEDCGEL
jgi:cyclophilin family peptidyl-prolyl cis-trans isomerase